MKHLIETFTLLVIFLSSHTAQAQESYVVKGNSVNIRETPNSAGKVLGRISGGEVVSVTNSSNSEWWLISYYGTEGYISSKYLIRLEESGKYKGYEKVSANTGDSPNCENIKPKYDDSLDNQLLIHAGNNEDVVVKVMNYSTCIRVVYIHAGDSYAIKNIPEGIYYLKIAYGKDYRQYTTADGNCNIEFVSDAVYEIGSDKLDYYRESKPDTYEGNYVVHHWSLPSFELSLDVNFSKGGSGGGSHFHSNKTSKKEFNN